MCGFGKHCFDGDQSKYPETYILACEIDLALALQFICSESEFGSGSPQLIAALPVTSNPEDQCQFFFEWKTHVACPANPKQLEGHWTAIGLLLVL